MEEDEERVQSRFNKARSAVLQKARQGVDAQEERQAWRKVDRVITVITCISVFRVTKFFVIIEVIWV